MSHEMKVILITFAVVFGLAVISGGIALWLMLRPHRPAQAPAAANQQGGAGGNNPPPPARGLPWQRILAFGLGGLGVLGLFIGVTYVQKKFGIAADVNFGFIFLFLILAATIYFVKDKGILKLVFSSLLIMAILAPALFFIQLKAFNDARTANGGFTGDTSAPSSAPSWAPVVVADPRTACEKPFSANEVRECYFGKGGTEVIPPDTSVFRLRNPQMCYEAGPYTHHTEPAGLVGNRNQMGDRFTPTDQGVETRMVRYWLSDGDCNNRPQQIPADSSLANNTPG